MSVPEPVSGASRGGARWLLHALLLVVPLLGCGGCGSDGPGEDEDKGWIDDTLDFGDKINWPGTEHAAGRVIPFIRGFGNGRAAAYWFLGFASRNTADSFWFCREGDEACPLDENQRLNWDTIVGHPLFTKIPGQSGFSPFWQMWKVTVPETFVPDSVKTVETLDRLGNAGEITAEPFIIDFGELFGVTWGYQEVVLHCALVLRDTELAENGDEMPDGSGPMLVLELQRGWHEGYRVQFVDFSPSDGVFPEAEDSEARPKMPFANIYIHWRWCDSDPRSEICDIATFAHAERRPVSERGLGEDITDDADTNDTNNTIGSVPCELQRPTEKPYSPLWSVLVTYVQDGADVSLIDTTGDQAESDVMSADDVFDRVLSGDLSEPEVTEEDTTGNPVEGNEGQIFFNCPNPVPVDHVPYPCPSPED